MLEVIKDMPVFTSSCHVDSKRRHQQYPSDRGQERWEELGSLMVECLGGHLAFISSFVRWAWKFLHLIALLLLIF